jgi:hypothetical protein
LTTAGYPGLDPFEQAAPFPANTLPSVSVIDRADCPVSCSVYPAPRAPACCIRGAISCAELERRPVLACDPVRR